MLKINKGLKTGKTHRYLGLTIGCQFLAWTISRLYFSWNDLGKIHGDHFTKKSIESFAFNKLISIDSIPVKVNSLKFIDVSETAYYNHHENIITYVDAKNDEFQSVRHHNWRWFDFLCMGHTMDYQGRDNFNNLLLRIFSLFGIFTVISGFLLWGVSSPILKKIKNRNDR